MAASGSWTPAKIFLVVLGVLAGLCVLCCGVGWLVFGDKIMSMVHFGTDTSDFVQSLQAKYGEKAMFGLEQDDQNRFIVTIGVPGELTPERVREVQDESWKLLCDAYSDHGFFPVTQLAVGEPPGDPGDDPSPVNWSGNAVTVEELAARTGKERPKVVEFLPGEFGQGRVKIKVGGRETKEGDGEPGGK